MAKTRSQIEAQMAALQAELEGADTDDEVWIREEDGPAIRVSGKRATAVLDKYKHLWGESGDGADGADDGADGADGADPAPASGYFGRKK
jgi:hypothetical protein